VLRIGKENRTFFYDPRNRPVARASVKDRVVFETVDCFDDQLKTEQDLAHMMDMAHMNPNTGPLFIEDAVPGDILVVKVIDIEPGEYAVATLVPGEGVLQDRAPGPVTKICAIEDRKTVFNEDIVIEPRLMVGTIGTTPLDRTPTGLPGDHGGNMDVPTMGIGAFLYFPVTVPGALLQMGDVQSAMGDGEICIGMECGAEVTVDIEALIKGRFLPGPMVENEDRWGIVANARTFEDATRLAVRRTAGFLTQRLDMTLEDAALLISTACDVKVAQWADANYDTVVYVEVPKYLDKKGRLQSF
jgi:amidase